ncbi:MAG: DUF968 domain-containing protein [Rhizobiales bacterium]|nr:DUF968 domain-containing protein [Hyphomicrobiales bacterium]OJY46453.1 MAG: hypothetical protein BGP08_15450 [Rhizobiales bacterium 64-17]
MGFSVKQRRALNTELKPSVVRTRQRQGRELSYIEGWHAIAEANRIFGPDGWNRETVETKCLLGRERQGQYEAVYVARVRITVRASDQTITRDGIGSGDAQGESLGEAHDKAIKTAETDATKRALATFGKPFGLSLYLGKHQPKPATKNQADIPPSALGEPALPVGPLDHIADKSFLVDAASASQSQERNETSLAEMTPTQNQARQDTPLVPALKISSVNPMPRPARKREPEHLRFVATQPCLLCGRTPSDAHHLKFTQPRAMSRKVSDEFTVPLCRTHHRQLHDSGNEIAWWIDMDIDPLPIAHGLWLEFLGARGCEKSELKNRNN